MFLPPETVVSRRAAESRGGRAPQRRPSTGGGALGKTKASLLFHLRPQTLAHAPMKALAIREKITINFSVWGTRAKKENNTTSVYYVAREAFLPALLLILVLGGR